MQGNLGTKEINYDRVQLGRDQWRQRQKHCCNWTILQTLRQKEYLNEALGKQISNLASQCDIVIMGDFNYLGICWNFLPEEELIKFLALLNYNFILQKGEEETEGNSVLNLNSCHQDRSTWWGGNCRNIREK